jgi:hypothetical protein
MSPKSMAHKVEFEVAEAGCMSLPGGLICRWDSRSRRTEAWPRSGPPPRPINGGPQRQQGSPANCDDSGPPPQPSQAPSNASTGVAWRVAARLPQGCRRRKLPVTLAPTRYYLPVCASSESHPPLPREDSAVVAWESSVTGLCLVQVHPSPTAALLSIANHHQPLRQPSPSQPVATPTISSCLLLSDSAANTSRQTR